MNQTTLQKLVSDLEEIKSRGVTLTMGGMITMLSNSLDSEKKMIEEAWDDAYEKGGRTREEKISNPVFDSNHYYQKKFKSGST
jgi:hypothetical protein